MNRLWKPILLAFSSISGTSSSVVADPVRGDLSDESVARFELVESSSGGSRIPSFRRCVTICFMAVGCSLPVVRQLDIL